MLEGDLMKSYYCIKELNSSFEAAITKIPEELTKEGFGILTDIDVKTTLKKKLDADFPPTGFWTPVIRPLLFIPFSIQ